jgi:hypothetical protein
MWLVYFSVGILPILLILYVYWVGAEHSLPFAPWFLLAGPAFVFVLNPLRLWVQINRAISATPSAQGPRTWSFTEDGVTIATEVSKSEMKWAMVVKVVETRSIFLFYLGPNIAHFLPKRFLPDPDDLRELRQLIRMNLSDKAHLQRETD